MIYAGILAGGKGLRMNNPNLPKQFVKINDTPIIIITLKKFLEIKNIEKIIVAINKDWTEYFNNLLKEYKINNDKIIIINGGNSRFESLVNITKKAYDLDKNSIIISHDCARPFVSKKIILENIKMIKKYDAVTTSIPTIDTIIVSEDNEKSIDVPDRQTLYLDQGPQTFYTKQFMELYKNISTIQMSKYIEIGKLYLDNSLKVGIVEGERTNFKITTNIDLKYAEFLLKEGLIR